MLRQGRLISDWAQPRHILVGWPQRQDTWRLNGAPARDAIVHFIQAVLSNTCDIHVSIIVGEGNHHKDIRDLYSKKWPVMCLQSGRFSVEYIPMNDCWIRDTGPFLVVDRNLSDSRLDATGVCFRFNAWGGANGGCYKDCSKDSEVAALLCHRFDIEARHVNMVLEGGSISSDGQGTLLVTRECLLNANRNPQLTKQDIERTLRIKLGAQKVIWLPFGAAYDTDTDGHVDNMAIFIRPGHVLLLWADQTIFPDQYRRSKLALQVLENSTDAAGNALVIHKVTAPPTLTRSRIEANGVQNVSPSIAKARCEGERLCASYVNVVITDEAVFAPAFGDVQADNRARAELEMAFAETGQSIVMVNAREIVLGGGGFHCMTATIPVKAIDDKREQAS
ncbi:agmatine deiminase [Gracilaria domingensis]|nr:agmatine deiminase [Gracilaria domingensis]